MPLGGGTGDAIIQATSTGSFALLAGTIDRMKDLNIAVVGGAGLPLDFFQTLLAEPTWNFVLEDVLSCGELGPNVDCAFGDDSPFGFVEAAGSTTVIMRMNGIVFDTTTPTLVSTWDGTFTAQFNQTIASIIDDFVATGSIDTSFSASKIVVEQVVPEPVTLGLLGLGLLGVAVRARRQRHSSS